MAQGRHAKKRTKSYKIPSVLGIAGLGATGAWVSAGQANAATADEWQKVADCESGARNAWGTPAVPGSARWNLAGGHATSTGGLQIQTPTWLDYGGAKYAPTAGQATKEQQIEIAEKILAGQGSRAWSVTWDGSCGPLTLSNTPYAQTPSPAPTPTPTPPKTVKPPALGKSAGSYTVKRGDWLIKIAENKLGAGSKWRALYDANRKVIGSNPNLIHPGQVLKLPGKPVAKSVQSTAAYVAPVQGEVGDSLIIGSGGSLSRTMGGHSGLDITAPQGTPVKAAAAGTVVSMNSSGGAYGLHVVVKHGEGLYTLYAHLSRISVSVGQSVGAGGVVGNVGSTGTSSGPHLHFEVRNHPTAFTLGTFLNPLTWLRSHGVSI